jgi:hypothetical protein
MENFDELGIQLGFEDDDDDVSFVTQPAEQPVEQPAEEIEDLTSEILKIRGINDINKIKFEDESGAVIERTWDTLTREE